MREIKFSAKKLNTDEWVFGNLILSTDRAFIVGSIGVYDDGSENLSSWNEVIPETVGQYTGLTDRNGTEIYEGDIIKWFTFNDIYEPWFYVKGLVYWADNFFEYRVKKGQANSLAGIVKEDIQVIGNIHDNPELLEDDSL